jgi:Sulfite exporter TauE/SafE
MIGALSLISPGDIRHVVALKNLLTGCLRGVAVILLVIEGNVDWKYGAPMALGGLVGGYLGGLISHRANRVLVRSIVIMIGFGVAAYYFWNLYGPAVMRIGGQQGVPSIGKAFAENTKGSTSASDSVIRTSYEKTIHPFLHGTDRSCSYLPWSSKPIEGR